MYMHVHYYMYSTCSRRTVHQIQPHKNFVIVTQFLVHLHSQPYLPYLNVLLKTRPSLNSCAHINLQSKTVEDYTCNYSRQGLSYQEKLYPYYQ